MTNHKQTFKIVEKIEKQTHLENAALRGESVHTAVVIGLGRHLRL